MEISIKELSEILSNKADATAEFTIGKRVFIRTVTNFFTGEVVGETGAFVSLKLAALDSRHRALCRCF